jgi:hypothetical protein
VVAGDVGEDAEEEGDPEEAESDDGERHHGAGVESNFESILEAKRWVVRCDRGT